MSHSEWINAEFQPDLVSVIIPTYNRAHLITNALNSVRNQTYRPIELLVVDDGSEDDTESVVRSWIAIHASEGFAVRYLHQRNGGAPVARNHGLVESRGEFIQFLDSDDLLLPHKLERQVDALLQIPDASYVWSERVHVQLERMNDTYKQFSNSIGSSSVRDLTLIRGYQKRNVPALVASGLYRRSACVLLGKWDEKLKRHQDWEYAVRFIASDMQAIHLPGTHYLHVSHSGPRVNNLTDRNIHLFVTACQAAEERFDNLQHQPDSLLAARYNVAILYLSAVLASLHRENRDEYKLAMTGVCRNMGNSLNLRIKTGFFAAMVSVLDMQRTLALFEFYKKILRLV